MTDTNKRETAREAAAAIYPDEPDKVAEMCALCERIGVDPDRVMEPMNPAAEALWDVREWLEKVCSDEGVLIDGAGFGMGEADLDISRNGRRYNVTIKPID